MAIIYFIAGFLRRNFLSHGKFDCDCACSCMLCHFQKVKNIKYSVIIIRDTHYVIFNRSENTI